MLPVPDHLGQLITALPAILAGLTALVSALGGIIIYKLNNMHKDMNGRLTELIRASVAQGRQDERDAHSVTVAGVPAKERDGTL